MYFKMKKTTFRFSQFCNVVLRFAWCLFSFTWFDKPLSMKPANYQERFEEEKKTTLNSTNRLNHILTLHQNDDIVLFCRFFSGSSWNLKHQSHSSHSGSFVVCTCFFLRMFPLFPLFAQCNNIQHFIYFFPMCIRFSK